MRIKERLKKEADDGYKKFSASLVPNINNILGVRLPVLRSIAKEIYKSGSYEDFLKVSDIEFMEETMLQGMIIGIMDKTVEEMLCYVKDFIPKIDNWSVCDCFCAGLKFTKNNLKSVWNFIQPYFSSQNEYELRFAYVMLLNYFVCDEYIDKILKLIDNFKDERYYSKMAAAWLVSVCFVKKRDKTLEYLKKSKLSKQTFNKSIQKICESFKVDKQDKELLKAMKK